jgi:hypothetical protein
MLKEEKAVYDRLLGEVIELWATINT